MPRRVVGVRVVCDGVVGLFAISWLIDVSDLTGRLVADLVAADRVVYRPEVLRHFPQAGSTGCSICGTSCGRDGADARAQRR